MAESAAEDERQHEAIKRNITIEAESLDFTVSFEKEIPQQGRSDLEMTVVEDFVRQTRRRLT